jgi:hypothetical protein
MEGRQRPVLRALRKQSWASDMPSMTTCVVEGLIHIGRRNAQKTLIYLEKSTNAKWKAMASGD